MDHHHTDMTAIEIRREHLGGDAARKLIGELDAELNRLYPEEGANFLLLDAAEVEEGRGAFLVARTGKEPVGCGAVRLRDTHTAEIKRMYVVPSARGRGIGVQVLAMLETEARRLGARRAVLETGERQPAALALYARAGYVVIPAFDEYAGAHHSLCMAKAL
jgi:GNAT superfamily N-acetyltransferase